MSPHPDQDRWRLVEDLFHHASELAGPEREAFLSRECAGDRELLREVESLLESDDHTLDVLKQSVQKVAAEIADAEDQAGRRIGPYQVIRLLGEGGMGKVYLAARADEQYQRGVAIKLMHAGLGARRTMLLRFRTERQILANLDHPHIARLLDGNVTENGAPYLVMEYVDGIPIHEYCRRHSLPVRERLRLFRMVASAVEYAHHNLVIHRDLKPANILVAADGVPKLLDFGIAKLLDPELSDVSLTGTTDRMMTPEYASPEQVQGDPVTTATDVYALGVLLYELLAGVRPFRMEKRSPIDIARIICEQDPPPPSAAGLANPESAPPDVRKVKGDLDSIVMMAMRKEPSRRYASVAQLAADVDAYLEGYPLAARTSHWSYRAERFVHRHRAGVAITVAAALALIGFSIGMGLLARRANRQQLVARREATFLSEMFRAVTPEAARGRTITARELLDLGAKRADAELVSEPEVRASLLQSIANAYRSLGVYDEGLAVAQRSHELQTRLYGADDPRTAASLETLAGLYREKADFKNAEPLFRRLLAMRRKHPGGRDLAVAHALGSLGQCLYEDSKDMEAEPILREALAIDREHGPDYGADVRSYLALLLEHKGDFSEARQLLQEAVDISGRAEGTDSPPYAAYLHNLASTLIDIGDLSGAEKQLRTALDIRRKVLGDKHPDLLYSLHNLGFVLLEEGEPRAAEPYIRESMALSLEILGEAHPHTAAARNNLARLMQAKGNYAGAETEYWNALEAFRATSGPVSWQVAQVLDNLSRLEFDRRNYAAAQKFAEQSRAMLEKVQGGDSPIMAGVLTELGEARLFQNDAGGAEPLLRQSLEIRRRKYAPGHTAIISAQVRLGEALLAEHRPADAEPILRAALDAARAAPFTLLPWQRAEVESALGACLRDVGRPVEAEKLLESSSTDLRTHPRPVFREPAPLRQVKQSVSADRETLAK